MREGVAKVMDDDDHEFVDLLHSLGVQRNVAKVITYLAIAGEATSWDIERGSSLGQPEVSKAIKKLHREKWVREWENETEGIGRPSKMYALSTPVEEIIRSIEDEKQKESAKSMESIQKLKDLASS